MHREILNSLTVFPVSINIILIENIVLTYSFWLVELMPMYNNRLYMREEVKQSNRI